MIIALIIWLIMMVLGWFNLLGFWYTSVLAGAIIYGVIAMVIAVLIRP